MGLRFNRRKGLGNGWWVRLGKTGPSIGRRGRRGSLSLNRRGPGGSIRIAKGISWLFGRGR